MKNVSIFVLCITVSIVLSLTAPLIANAHPYEPSQLRFARTTMLCYPAFGDNKDEIVLNIGIIANKLKKHNKFGIDSVELYPDTPTVNGYATYTICVVTNTPTLPKNIRKSPTRRLFI